MKAVVQRVKRASITTGHESPGSGTRESVNLGSMGIGLFVLLGLMDGDTDEDLDWVAGKIGRLRVFDDDDGKMNLSLADVGGTLAVVSQFTLCGDVRRGNRPSWSRAMPVSEARDFWPRVRRRFEGLGIDCIFGRFQAMMDCEIVNDGPVTLIVDSADRRRNG
ncbi:MAG: D-tyrosyl-tRNA(Tyr) deacylase [Deltaproteobacteria bacterium]|nr:D-tyrosyl-tRNA(Tyr) deacylase [Deltaproteobacteria bacterium]